MLASSAFSIHLFRGRVLVAGPPEDGPGLFLLKLFFQGHGFSCTRKQKNSWFLACKLF